MLFRPRFLALAVTAAMVASAVALKLSPVPFTWIGAVWAVVLFGAIRRVSSPLGRGALLYSGVALITLAVYESYLYLQTRHTDRRLPHYSAKFKALDDVFAVVPISNVRTRATRAHGDRVDYDVTYSIDSRGLRIGPPTPADESGSCVLFFGCSFTFGEGLEDREALPYQVGLRTAGRYTVRNFGFSGYGPHHMLAAIQRGRVERVVGCTPTHVIYTAVPDHVRRAAGRSRYPFGPGYALGADGRLEFKGLIDGSRALPLLERSRLLHQLTKSHIYQAAALRLTPDEQDLRLYVQIVKSSEALLRQKYPQASFHVLLWDDVPFGETDLYSRVRDRLMSAGLTVHLVADILPNYRQDRIPYTLSPDDQHPSGLANELLAQWLVERILKE